MTKKKKPVVAAKVRNKVATNPLLLKGGSHQDKRADERMARSRSRRALRKQFKAWDDTERGGSDDSSGKENWQKGAGIFIIKPTAFCQFSFSPA